MTAELILIAETRIFRTMHHASRPTVNSLKRIATTLGPGDKHEQGISIRLTMGLRPFNQNMQGTSQRHVIGCFYGV